MNVIAVTLFFWVFVRPEYMDQKVTINHERIHVAQYKETLLIGFFLFYSYDFIKNILKGMSWDQAYRNIRMEKEAYQKQYSMDYLRHRKLFSWWNL